MIGTSRRVLCQLRHDPRTIAQVVVVPALLMVLLRFMFNSAALFARAAPALIALLPFVLMFLITSIATLRERTTGILERLMTTPLSRIGFVFGYLLAFSAVAVVQVMVVTLVASWLGMAVVGSALLLFLVALVGAVLGVGLGLLASAFSATEFQAVQMIPLVVFPQVFLCGLFQPRLAMAAPLRWLSDALPLSYGVEAVERVAFSTAGGLAIRDLLIVAGFVAVSVVGAAATLRRRS